MAGPEVPNMTVIKGLIAVTFGITFIFFAYTIILRMIFFMCGLLLTYYGLQLLNITVFNDAIKNIRAYLKKYFS
jgi:hypothetical protein